MKFEVGDEIHHEGEQGRFVILKVRPNGDLDCFGGLGGCQGIKDTTGHAQWRTFRPSECRKAKMKRVLRKT